MLNKPKDNTKGKAFKGSYSSFAMSPQNKASAYIFYILLASE